VDGAVAGAVLLPAAAGLDELAEVGGADDVLGDDAQPAANATQISAATARPARAAAARPAAGFPLPERSRIANTPVPSHLWAPPAPSSKV
jgi:hypothetical protein